MCHYSYDRSERYHLIHVTIPVDPDVMVSTVHASIVAPSTHIMQKYAKLHIPSQQTRQAYHHRVDWRLIVKASSNKELCINFNVKGRCNFGIAALSVAIPFMLHATVLTTERFRIPCPCIPEVWHKALLTGGLLLITPDSLCTSLTAHLLALIHQN